MLLFSIFCIFWMPGPLPTTHVESSQLDCIWLRRRSSMLQGTPVSWEPLMLGALLPSKVWGPLDYKQRHILWGPWLSWCGSLHSTWGKGNEGEDWSQNTFLNPAFLQMRELSRSVLDGPGKATGMLGPFVEWLLLWMEYPPIAWGQERFAQSYRQKGHSEDWTAIGQWSPSKFHLSGKLLSIYKEPASLGYAVTVPPQKDIPFSRLKVLVGFVSHYEPVLSAPTLAQRKEEKLALTTLNILKAALGVRFWGKGKALVSLSSSPLMVSSLHSIPAWIPLGAEYAPARSEDLSVTDASH